VEREACRRGFDQAVRRAIVADGAKWIWNLADEDYPDAIQILDLFHAKGHLWDVAKLFSIPRRAPSARFRLDTSAMRG